MKEDKKQHEKLLTITLKEMGFAPGILNSQNQTITAENHRDVEMELLPGYVLVKMNGKRVGVPLGNLKGFVFAE